MAPGTLSPGDQISIDVILEHAEGFHTWPHEPVIPPEFEGLMPIATAIEVTSLPEGAAVEEIEWPAPVPVTVRYTGQPIELLSYTDTVIAHIRLRLSPDQPPGGGSVGLRVRYQTCDEVVCYPPKTVEVAVPLRLEPPLRGRGRTALGDRKGS